MEVKLIMKSARNAVIEIADGGIYNTKETYHVLLNGEEVFSTDTVINSLFDLKPQTSYEVSVRTADGTELGTVYEVYTGSDPSLSEGKPCAYSKGKLSHYQSVFKK